MDSFWGSWQNLVFVSIILGTMVHFQDSEYHSVQASWKKILVTMHGLPGRHSLTLSFCFIPLNFCQFSSVQPLSHVPLFVTPWTAACEASLAVHHQLPEFTQTHVHRVSDAIQPSHPLSSPSPPDPNPSQHQGLFQWVSSSHQVAKVLEFQLQHQSFQWIFRTDFLWIEWLNLLAVQGTLKSLLQHHSSKVSSLRHSAFFIVQLSCLYMTTGKTIALIRWTFVGKVMSLLFNMLSRLITAFHPRSKRLLIS